MLQAQMVLDQVISLVTTHWQQDVSEVYVCTAITRDNLYFRIFSEPGRQRTLITAGKQDEGTVSIKIDD